MRTLATWLAAGFVSLSLSSAFAAPRDIIIILTDDHRFDALGHAGHPFLETPNLDRLAREGAHFTNAFVTTSLCSPSRASILTGLYAHHHEVVDNYHPVREDLHFFPQSLQAAGYETAFVGKWHMGDTDEPQRGFDHWVSFRGQGVYWPHDEGLKVKGRYVPQANRTGFNINGNRVPQEGYITDELTDYALEWLESRTGDAPRFLYLSHKAVHADFLPPNRFAYRYEEEPFDPPANPATQPDAFHGVPMWVQNQRNSRHGVEFAYYTELDLGNYYRRYCETILAVDESVGRLLESLEQRGKLDSTAILYLGDNGFLFGEHGLIDKRCAYEESIRIPMMLHCPELVPAGTVVPEMVANIDVAPTLLEIAGTESEVAMSGSSMVPLLGDRSGGEPEWREGLLYEYFWERNYPQTPTMHALREDRFKYIRYHGIWDTDELYDLKADPQERNNLIADPEHADRVVEMNRKLFELLQSSGGMNLRLLEDRGTKFLHRKIEGSEGAPFPERFYREAGTSGR